ncbi:hypothetical protein [Geodermatophilus sp. URMC 65]
MLTLGGTGQLWFIGSVSLVLVGLLVAAVAYDVRTAARMQSMRLEIIRQLVSSGKLDATDANVIGRSMDRPTTGVTGLTRTLLALSILMIVGLALVAAVVSSASDAADLRKTIITSLLGVFGTVVGFYFGSRTAQTSAEAEGHRRQEPVIPPKDIPPKDIPPKDIPPKDTPPKDTPPKDTPPKDTPPKDIPPKDTPPKDTT